MGNEAIFEVLRQQLDAMPCPKKSSERTIHWLSLGRMGIAKNVNGGFEIFFGEPQVIPNRALVKRGLEFKAWEGQGGILYQASRIELPSEPHFLSISALIGTEAVIAGIESPSVPLQKVFEAVEPLIALALKRAFLSDEPALGLIGELILLDQMLALIMGMPEHRIVILETWRGFTASSRDFIIGESAIEVKSTTLPCSTHMIHSLEQVEPKELPSGELESDLLLLSIGLTPVLGGPFSLAALAERILARLGPLASGSPDLTTGFLDRLKRYGALGGWGYDHLDMKDTIMAKRTYAFSFTPRLYDIKDPAVKILRQQDLVGTMVNPHHVQYQIDLPETISKVNPSKDWEIQVKGICMTALGLN